MTRLPLVREEALGKGRMSCDLLLTPFCLETKLESRWTAGIVGEPLSIPYNIL
jgi:hypothetical protein